MLDSLPLFPDEAGGQFHLVPRLQVVHSVFGADGQLGYLREREVLLARWEGLCTELEAIDRRLEELDTLIGGW